MTLLASYLNYCSKIKMLQSFYVQKRECSESRESQETSGQRMNAAAAAMAAILGQ
jgi:hypothetical protein